ESIAYRLEQLETRGPSAPFENVPVAAPEVEEPVRVPVAVGGPPDVELEQLQEAWARTIVPAVAAKSIPISAVLGEARPADLDGDTLTVEFPATASFHRQLAEEPKNTSLLRDALYEVTGRKLAITFAVGEDTQAAEEEIAQTEEDFVSLFKDTFDAREIEEDR